MNKIEKLSKLNKILKLAWQVRDFERRGYGFDLVSQSALSINMYLNKSMQDTDAVNRLTRLAWSLHVRINTAEPTDLPTVSVRALYSELKQGLDEFITDELITTKEGVII